MAGPRGISAFRNFLANAALWVSEKAAPPPVGYADAGPTYIDFYRRQRAPSDEELLDEYQRVAYACARINANAVSSTPLKVYVQTNRGQARPKCFTRQLGRSAQNALRARAGLETRLAKAVEIEEVLDHPLINLLNRVNPFMTRVSLLQLTDLYQEILGNAYWLIAANALGTPEQIWPLQSHHVRINRSREKIIASYTYGRSPNARTYPREEVMHFRFPNLRDPYGEGIGPMRAAYEDVVIDAKLLAHENAVLDNRARPDAIVSPEEPIGRREAERLENKLRKKFGRGGAGGILVAESGMKLTPTSFPPRDLQGLARRKMTKVELANVFDVPISLLETENVNRANAEAGHYQHALMAVRPRCKMIEGAINEDLCPRFDERLFVAFDDPVPQNREQQRLDHEKYLAAGVLTINMVRRDLGLRPAPWGDVPYIPKHLAPIDDPARHTREQG
ncbi:MAG: phage portal protein [Planctomycetes bacterium]|nr:phage portal protein [Planctomycetota bacterium]